MAVTVTNIILFVFVPLNQWYKRPYYLSCNGISRKENKTFPHIREVIELRINNRLCIRGARRAPSSMNRLFRFTHRRRLRHESLASNTHAALNEPSQVKNEIW